MGFVMSPNGSPTKVSTPFFDMYCMGAFHFSRCYAYWRIVVVSEDISKRRE